MNNEYYSKKFSRSNGYGNKCIQWTKNITAKVFIASVFNEQQILQQKYSRIKGYWGKCIQWTTNITANAFITASEFIDSRYFSIKYHSKRIHWPIISQNVLNGKQTSRKMYSVQQRSQNPEKVTHIKGRLLDQTRNVFNCILFQMGTSLKGKNLLP